MVVVDGQGIPLGAVIESAQPAEIKLAPRAVANVKVPRKGPGRPRTRLTRLIADKAYDSDAFRDELAKTDTELISPHRRNRKEKRQDGRALRRYKHRWIVERTFAWLHNFRRLRTRDDRSLVVYSGFFHIALMILALRRL